MKPWKVVERALAPDGVELVLARREDEWVVRAASKVLMSSRTHGSEEELATLAVSSKAKAVLVGGLGMGFTLRATLNRLPPQARVWVSEWVPAVVEWNQTHLASLAGNPLKDSRVQVELQDVRETLKANPETFDAVLLDVDNGPSPLAHTSNQALYSVAGIRTCTRALRSKGVLALWSAGFDEGYLRRLKDAGLDAQSFPCPARPGSRAGHVIFLGAKR